MLKTPFRLPEAWLTTFGYCRGRRFVGIYGEPCGDEACYDDGVYSACGLADNWLYLGFKRQPQVQQWLSENGIHLGSSERSARHWLIADAETGDLYVAPQQEAHAVVRAQRLPDEGEQPATT